MQMINVPKLRMAQLQTFTEGVLKTTANLTEVAPQVFRRHKHSRLEVLQLAERQNVDVWGFRIRAETSFMRVSLFLGEFEGF